MSNSGCGGRVIRVRRGTVGLAWWAACLLAAFSAAPVRGDMELLLFPALEAVHRDGLDPGPKLDENETLAEADFFFTLADGRLRVLGEFLIDKH